MKKRITSLLMALVLALSLVPATVWAEDGPVEVSTFDQLKAAVDAENSTIVLTADIDLTASLLIDSATADITIRSKEGEIFTLKRADDFTSYAINVKDGGKLTLENITLDGNGEVVQSNYPFIYMKTTEVNKQTDSELHLKSGATIQNCVATNNGSSYGGAIYSVGSVYMYEGSAITNCSAQVGGAIYLAYTTWSTSGLKKFANFTMYGGTISGCSSTSTYAGYGGGALYAYGNVNVNLLGGVIEKNSSASHGGGVHVQTYKYSNYINVATVNFAGTTIQDNTAAFLGGGVYFNGDTQDTLTASGVTNITGNNGKNGTDNVYLVAGRTLADKGLEDGSAIGVSGPNVPSLLVAGTNVNSGCFTADRVDAKLVSTENGLQLEAKAVHEHCICGRTDCKGTGAGHEKLIYRGVSSPELITTKGNYFLMNDTQLTNSNYSWTAPAGVTLCLDGHTLRRGGSDASTVIVVTGGNTFNLTDCHNNAGKVTSSYFSSEYNRDEAKFGTGVSVAKNATFNLYGGTISGNIAYNSTNMAAGGVVVNGTFNMYGGQLVNNYRRISTDILGSAVMVFTGGTFNLVDGLIARNASQDTEYGNTSTIARNGGAVYVKGGTFNMSGGEISKNVAGGFYAPSDGGGVYVSNSGVFNMSGGVIANNTVSRNGGGVYVANGTFTMSKQARVTGNTAYLSTDESNYRAFNGGGVYVGANGTFTMNDSASVDTNTAKCGYKDVLASGGGVYVENGGVFTMNDQAAVKDNTVPVQYKSSFSDTVFGGGIYVNGTLNLNGGSVTGNTAYLRGGGIYVDTKATVNLGTGTVTVKDNTIHEGDFTENVYLTGETKLVAKNAPAKDTSIGISVPLSRVTAGSVVITNAEKSIKAGDARFPLDISEISLERSGDDLKVTLPVHKHGAITYTPVERLSDIKGTGNYYLVQDSLMTGQLTVAAGTTVNICLNGHKSASTNIINNGTLTITDCLHDSANGYLTSNYSAAITNNTGAAELTLNSVTVKDATGTFINVNEKKDANTGKAGGSTVTLLNSTFTNNGGAVLDICGTTATVRNCTFENNKNRAILASYSLDYNGASLTIENSKFIGNCISSAYYTTGGGAIYCNYFYSAVTISGCTFTGNSALQGNGYGGALWMRSKKMKISDCTFTGNTAKWYGGAIFVSNDEDVPVLGGTIIAEKNTANGVENNIHLDGSRSSGAYITVDSTFNAAKSHVGISADNIPTLAVKGTTNPAGFFADGGSSYTLRSTADKSAPLLTSGNTGLELWHRGNDHTHCVCGTGTNTADSDHTHSKSTKWIGVTTLKDLPEGNYFLLKDRSNYPYGAPWTPVGNSNLCLNGHTYTIETNNYAPGVVVGKNVSASITDCSEEGTGKFTGTDGHQGVSVTSGGTFTLWRGSLSKFIAATSSSSSSSYRSGGGVNVSNGTFIMNGGSITGCTATAGVGGGVYVVDGTFLMNGGAITGCRTMLNSTNNGGRGGGVNGVRSTITISGGSITDNKATNGGGLYASYCLLTVDGATITGNTATGSGGGLYLALPEYKGNSRIESWYPAVIQNATITNNKADLGGGIYAVGAFKMNGIDITGNTATTNGGGLYSNVYTTYTQDGWVYDLSGKMNITGNKVGEAANNLYLANGSKLPTVTGLAADSTIGVSTEKDTLQGETIIPVYITSDAGNKDYFTSDADYKVKLDSDKNQLYIIAESSTVTITPDKNMTASGSLKQTVLQSSPIAEVTITANEGYYFPEGYGFTQNGITVTRVDLTHVTVSGTPTAEEVALTLPAATAKTTPTAPGSLTGVAPSIWDAADGKISGTKSTMEWSTDKENWIDCTDNATTVGSQGTYYVRVKATDISYASEATEVTVPKYLKSIEFPRPGMTDFPYDGTEHTLLVPGEGYTVEGDITKIDAGSYTVTVKLESDKYQWSATPESSALTWIISKRAARAADFTFTAPTDRVWDGHPKTAAITLNSPYTLGGCETSLVYKQNGQVVENPTDPGTYQVYLVISGDGNFAATDGLTADSWKFEILHPADHQWGEWQHNDTQHYRTCRVPGCTKEQRAAHTTDTLATCITKAVCTVCRAEYGALDAHNHPTDKVSSTAYKAPTCGAAGNEAYSYCADCHKYFSGKDGDTALYPDAAHFAINPLNHQNVSKTDAVAADCYNGGHEAYWQCADCKQYFADKNGKADLSLSHADASVFNTEPLNHSGATRTAAVPATCTEGGRDAYWHCSACGGYFADKNGTLDPNAGGASPDDFNTISLGHTYSEEIVAPEHLKTAATCTEDAVYSKSCVRCGTNGTETFTAVGTALGHDFKGQSYQSDAADHWQLCKRDNCNAESTHEEHSGNTATCVTESKCATCGYKLADKNPNNHTNPTLHDAVAPTCTVKGHSAYYSCPDCGKFFSGMDGDTALYDNADHFDIAPLNHKDAVKTDAVAPTCELGGNTAYWHCLGCGKYFADNNGSIDLSQSYDSADTFVLGKLGHDYTGQPYQSSAEGHWQLCKRDGCGHPSLIEKHTGGTATCTEQKTCEVCHAKYGDPLGHTYTKYVYNNDATYDADGTETASCDHGCGETDTRTKVGSKLIDSDSPVITGVESGKTYCKQVLVTVTDVNSFTVTLNGQSVTPEDGKLTVTGLAGEQTLVATDRFGNSTTVSFTVNPEHTSDDGIVTTESTAAAEGVKTYTCTVCGEVLRTEPVAKIAPTIVEGAGGKYQSGDKTGLTFKSDAALEDFLSVSVDGKVLSASQYTVSGDGITVTLLNSYLSTLSVGQHTLGVTSASGTASTVFTVTAAPTVVPTGDTADLALWLSLAAMCGLGGLVVITRKKRENG